jgi:hypothetical protein
MMMWDTTGVATPAWAGGNAADSRFCYNGRCVADAIRLTVEYVEDDHYAVSDSAYL